MYKFLNNLKKYYPLLLNALVLPLIFFLPLYSTYFVDEIDTISYTYNFFKLLDFSVDEMYSAFNILILFSAFLNLIFFVLFMSDSFKIIRYRKNLNKIIYTFSFIILITSIVLLFYTIYIANLSSNGLLVYYNKFKIGSIILLIYSIVQIILVSIKINKKYI